jgi:putative transposase
VRFAAIAKLRGIWPLRWLCETFNLSCGGFYAWLKRPESERARVDGQLTAAIRTSFSESDRTYGARRVRSDLRDWGYRCGINLSCRQLR